MTPFAVIVPARLHSLRLPEKPLADIGGTAMIVRVLARAAQSGAARVLAAVDDERVAQAARAAGFAVQMTAECESGTMRAAAAAAAAGMANGDIIVNVQGDEPFIEPSLVRRVAELLAEKKHCFCATAARPLRDAAEFNCPSTVKVLPNRDGLASWFSRAPLPFLRADNSPPDIAVAGVPPGVLAHIGIYAYRADFLQTLPTLAPSPFEQAEQLEQLRMLWHGYPMALLRTVSDSFGVDTEEDLARARRVCAELGDEK